MPSPHTTAAYPDLVTDVGIRFQAKLQTFPQDNIFQMYSEEPWTTGDPRRMTFQTYALPTWGERRTELERPKKLSATMGNQIVKEFCAYSGAVDVTDFMLKFDREKIADQLADQLAKAVIRTKTLEMTHQALSYADLVNYQPKGKNYTVSFATPDGLPLGSANHTVPGQGSTPFSNVLANKGPLTRENLTLLIAQLQRETVDDAGELVPVLDFDTLVITNDFEVKKRAIEILNTPNVPFSGENTVNVYAGGMLMGKPMKLMVLPHGAIARDGTYADGTQNDGTGVTATKRRFHWGVLASELAGSLKYGSTGSPEVFKAAPMENGVYSIWANDFAVFTPTRWQGRGFSFSETL